MTILEIMQACDAKLLNEDVDTSKQAEYGYSCDLLSWVMARGCEKTAWITVMTHMNVIAVAALLDMACVIIPENVEVEGNILLKASEEGIPVLRSEKTAFELSGILYEKGLKRPKKG